MEFKSYPEFEPSYKGIHYLTIVGYDDTGGVVYSIVYFNDDCEFEPKEGLRVIAFTETDPKDIQLITKK